MAVLIFYVHALCLEMAAPIFYVHALCGCVVFLYRMHACAPHKAQPSVVHTAHPFMFIHCV